MSNTTINRPRYLHELASWRDKDVIKVITGVRRCGKSTLFAMFRAYLQTCNVQSDQIISINLEDLQYADIDNYKKLFDYINSRLLPDKNNYIFIDEVQNIDSWEKAIDSLYIKPNADVYITGSNSNLLSSELATLLSGRYIEIKMLPLSFAEFVSGFADGTNSERLYANYISDGSFPYLFNIAQKSDIRQYLEGIYNTIIIKDIMHRNRVGDKTILQAVINFMLDNIGNICSTKKIADTLNSSGRKISVHTVENYIEALCDSYVFYRVGRFDTKGKQYLKTGHKYYVCDLGLRYYLLGGKGGDDGHILENVVYLELLRRGLFMVVFDIAHNCIKHTDLSSLYT